MKKCLVAVFLIMEAMVGSAMADRGDQYLLPKLGFMSVDLYDADPLFSLGILYGFGITSAITFEGEVNLGISGGEYSKKDASNVVGEAGEYKIWTVAGYGVYRFPIRDYLYLKGKAGLLYESIERTSDIREGDTATGFGFAGGLGAGVIFGQKLTLELEATGIDESIIFYSLGFHYAF
jgi:hypothetical protein